MSGAAINMAASGVAEVDRALARIAELGRSPRPLWQAIGQYGESSTRLRFKHQTGPDGVRWKASQRAKKTGGQTLQLKGHLLRSISYNVTDGGVEWGSNRVYAAIHQFGGQIQRAAYSGWARLRTNAKGELERQKGHSKLARFAGAQHKRFRTVRFTAAAHVINMPARPYLGINQADLVEIGKLATDIIDQRTRGGA